MDRRKAISGLGALLGATAIGFGSKAADNSKPQASYRQNELPVSVRQKKVLSDGWQFMVDIKDIGEKEQWFANTFDASKWSTVHVPQAWDTYEAGLWEYEGIAWYKTTINATDFDAVKRNILKFNRVMFYTKVWLNGEVVGENIDGYLPFDFDITKLLKPNQANSLVIRVDNKPRIEWLPGGKQIEWIQYGGILEKVELTGYAFTYIEDLTIITKLQPKGAAVSCIVVLVNDTAKAVKTLVEVTISREKSEYKKSQPVTLKANETKNVTIDFTVPDAQLWSPETPILYQAKAALTTGGIMVDDLHDRFGIREVSVSGTSILLNGKQLTVKGVNRYDDYGRFGPNVPDDLLHQDLALMKSAGINFIRVHYPQSADLLSLYDEYGFVMMEEIPLNWWGITFFGDTLQSLDILKFAKPALTKMIKRDKNHPCLIIWSMANESGTNNEIGITAMRDLLKQAKQLDATRLVTFVASQSIKGHLAYEDADIVCVNMYNGIFSEHVCNHISDIVELGQKPMVEQLTEYRNKVTTKPLFISEFGCAGIKGIHGDASHTEEFQAAYIEKIWEGIRSVDGVTGGVLWCWEDYFHRKYYIAYAAFGPYGVVTIDRKTKLSFEALKRMYS